MKILNFAMLFIGVTVTSISQAQYDEHPVQCCSDGYNMIGTQCIKPIEYQCPDSSWTLYGDECKKDVRVTVQSTVNISYTSTCKTERQARVTKGEGEVIKCNKEDRGKYIIYDNPNGYGAYCDDDGIIKPGFKPWNSHDPSKMFLCSGKYIKDGDVYMLGFIVVDTWGWMKTFCPDGTAEDNTGDKQNFDATLYKNWHKDENVPAIRFYVKGSMLYMDFVSSIRNRNDGKAPIEGVSSGIEIEVSQEVSEYEYCQ